VKISPWALGLGAAAGVFLVAKGVGAAQQALGNQARVVTVVFENKRRGAVMGSAQAPTFNLLAQQYRDLTGYASATHPSLPNYITMTSGSTQGITDDQGFTVVGSDNIFSELDAAGMDWRSYAESLPGPCPTGDTSLFARRHVPTLYYDNVTTDPTYCAAHVVDYSQFANDVSSGNLPAFSFVTPNICNDAHDCSIATADAWLANFVALLQASPQWPNIILFVLFDETEGGGTNIPAILVSPLLSNPGQPDPTPYSHVAYLATVQDLLHLSRSAATQGVQAIPL
jgi:hypothetical protein